LNLKGILIFAKAVKAISKDRDMKFIGRPWMNILPEPIQTTAVYAGVTPPIPLAYNHSDASHEKSASYGEESTTFFDPSTVFVHNHSDCDGNNSSYSQESTNFLDQHSVFINNNSDNDGNTAQHCEEFQNSFYPPFSDHLDQELM
jgi:hypothetical protein